MNRLQKKCVLVSAGFHLLLLVILLVGPAFVSSRNKRDDTPVLTFIPMITTDAQVAGGGNPNAAPLAPAPVPPAPQPPVKPPPPRPQPIKEIVRPPEPSPEPMEKKRKLPKVSTTVVRRPQPTAPKSSSPINNAEARRREAVDRALRNLRNELSSSTTVDMPGPGGGGPTYANFLQSVKTVYANAWIVPDGVTDDQATAEASVTIARDGTVLNARILRRSGNALADESVEVVLRRVKFVVPLPEDTKENQRTVTIKFSVKARRGLG